MKKSDIPVILVGLFLVLAAACLVLHTMGRFPLTARPNIILITVDALRADFLGCYGHPRNTTPNIDKFASQALLFEKCFSNAPETRLSFAGMFTGFLPGETKTAEALRLPLQVETLAEILQRRGYFTAAVVSNYILHKGMGFEQGFSVYDDTMRERDLVWRWPERTAENTTDKTIEFLKKYRKKRLFMWIHYQDPHGPYTPPERFAGLFRDPAQKPRIIEAASSSSGRGGIPTYQLLRNDKDYYSYLARYEGEIRYQDEQFKRLVGALKQSGMYDDSLIIFSSDHGEGMGEHDYYFAHGENLYNILTHVPLIIKYGDSLRGRRKDFVHHLDLVPTIFSILGIKQDERFRGSDLRPAQPEEKEIFMEMNSFLDIKDKIKYALITNGLKLIYTPFYNKYELYNLNSGFTEENDLINEPDYAKQAANLKSRLHHIRRDDRLGLKSVRKRRKFSEEELKSLRSLGYVQ